MSDILGALRDKVKVDVDVPLLKASADKGLVGAIDQGTSSTRFVVFTKDGKIAASAQVEHTQIFPSGEDKVGWHEHDPLEIWKNTCRCVDAVSDALTKQAGLDGKTSPLYKAVGITNQRETTLAWNADTGKPYFHAVVWDDVRTQDIAADIAGGNIDLVRDQTGLPLSSYSAGTRVKWLIDNVPELQNDLHDPKTRDSVRFGTIDTWLVYQLSGKPSPTKGAGNVGGIFITDVTNACRWLFMDLAKVQWDQSLVDTICKPHSVPVSALPEIKSSSEVYATASASCGINSFDNVPVCAILGDQQAALFGQGAFQTGEAKNTYGTGMFLMMNTGSKMVPSTHGLLTTIAFQIGKQNVVYALEGSVSHSGSTIQWLRDRLRIIDEAPDSETVAASTTSNDGLYFVPAFAGLFAPHWRADARGCIVGMTATHHKGHVCRAALEAAAYQTRDIFEAIYNDSGVRLKQLKVDGGASANKLLMQFQADMISADVVRPVVMETTSMGAAFAAGLAVGVWKSTDEIQAMWAEDKRFKPSMDEKQREKYWKGWKKAISKSKGWIGNDANNNEKSLSKSSASPTMGMLPLAVTAVAAAAFAVGVLVGKKQR